MREHTISISGRRQVQCPEVDLLAVFKVKSLSHVQLFATPWTLARQASLSMGLSRQECYSGLPFPSPGDLPEPGIKRGSPALQADSLLLEPAGKPWLLCSRSITKARVGRTSAGGRRWRRSVYGKLEFVELCRSLLGCWLLLRIKWKHVERFWREKWHDLTYT